MDLDNLNINITAVTERAQASIRALASALRGLVGASREGAENLDNVADAEDRTTESARESWAEHKKLSSVFKTVGKAVLSVGGAFRKNLTPDMQKSFLTVLKYAFGIRSLFVALKKLRSAIKDGFGNLRQYSNEVDGSLTMMTNSLTQVKNALAVAFAPIVTAIVPYVRALANAITVLLNKLAQLLGALTGRSFVVQADEGFGDIASGVDAVGGSAGSSKKKVDELKKALMGFDEINKLPDASDVGSGGGSGGGGSATDVSGMFKTVEVDSVFKDFADLVKKSIETGDFSEVGAVISRKLNESLQSIDWATIKTKASKMGREFATFINGAINSEFNGKSLGTTLGVTLGEAVNTGISYFKSFSSNLDFKGLGRSIADFINGAIKTINWGGLGKSISNGLVGALTTLNTAVQGIDPQGLADAITQFLSSVDWGGIVLGIAEFIGSAVMLALRTLTSIGGNIVQGIMQGFLSGSISRSVKSFFKRLVKAVKRVFGIKSPAKAPEIRAIGKNIVLGILEGFSGGFPSIGKWAGKLKDKIVEKFQKAKEKGIEIKDILSEKLEGVEDWVAEAKEGIAEKWSETKTDLKEGFNATVEVVKGKIDAGLNWLFGSDSERVTRKLDVTVPSTTEGKIKGIKKAWTDFRNSSSPAKGKNKRTLSSTFSYKENGKKSDGSGGVLSKVRSWWQKHSDAPSSKTIKSSFSSTGTSSLEKVQKKWADIKSSTKKLTLTLAGKGADLIASAKKKWDSLKDKVLKIGASVKLPKISFETKTKTVGPVSFSYPWPTVRFAKGGFPEDGWFRANHGEVMGKFDNGQSVVANNMQITEGIARAVEHGMVRAFMVANGGSGQGGNNQQPIIVKVGDKTVYSGFVDYVRKTTYATGTNPILI